MRQSRPINQSSIIDNQLKTFLLIVTNHHLIFLAFIFLLRCSSVYHVAVLRIKKTHRPYEPTGFRRECRIPFALIPTSRPQKYPAVVSVTVIYHILQIQSRSSESKSNTSSPSKFSLPFLACKPSFCLSLHGLLVYPLPPINQ